MDHSQERRINWVGSTSALLLWGAGAFTAFLRPGNAATHLIHPALLWALLGWIPCLVLLGTVSSATTYITNTLARTFHEHREPSGNDE